MDEIIKKLKEKNKTISSMESCTGGYFVNEITNIEGASEVLKFSAITYSNEFKIKMGVNPDVIDKYSVYSMETADEMSKKISDFSDSDYGIGITGKLNRQDENNPYNENNVVFVSIYDRFYDKYYNFNIRVNEKTRCDNKKIVVDKIVFELNNLI